MGETIDSLTGDRVAWLTREHTQVGWKHHDGYFEGCWDAQQKGELLLLVARIENTLLGWVTVAWRPDYAPFKEAMIPEVRDLNVLPAHRRKGVATRLLDRAETVIGQKSSLAGIAVGLNQWYGGAQRLYATRGYVPDGRGVSYHNEIVEAGQEVKVDDDLELHLTKSLGSQTQRGLKDQTIGYVTVVVKDYDNAIAFYVDSLGFRLIEDTFIPAQNKRRVLVAPPGATGTRLLLARAVGEAQSSRIGNQTGGRVFLFLHTVDFLRDFDAFKYKGVVFVRDPKEEPYGTVAVFRDLYGNLWDLLQLKDG
jgi:catechol 2,3-dioxygenase-like lactoylglutathione lyase family enzyme/GNAT superfamily N-acetyltransferase